MSLYYMTVSYKGYDQERDRRIINKVGSRHHIGGGSDFVWRDVEFSFRLEKALSAAKRRLRGFRGLRIQSHRGD